jgi:hypothetical protein
MGGVDVTDLCWMHCNSMVMGQNRWWLKLFFYLLDVSVSSEMIIYKEAMGLDNI